MNKPNPAPEPTMEEILASIRRIISDGDAAAAPPKPADDAADDDEPHDEADVAPEAAESDADIFDLTDEMVAEEPEPEPAELKVVEPEDADEEEVSADPDADDFAKVTVEKDEFESIESEIVDPDTLDVAFGEPEEDESAEAVTPKLSPVAEVRNTLMSPQTDAAVASAFGRLANTILTHDPRTLEDLVGDMLRPMLKDWLDDNLPVLVERLVREEIERVSRGRR